MSFEYSFNKNANLDKLTNEINLSGILGLNAMNLIDTSLTIVFNQELTVNDLNLLTTIVSNHNNFDQKKYVESLILKSINFGNELISEFAAENVMMGITQDGMTGTVRKHMSEVVSALNTGSLYDAIIEAKAIPAEHKDGKYITNARLLTFINKLETYLGITLTTSL